MLEYGADAAITDKDGKTALQRLQARPNSNPRTMRLLADAGARLRGQVVDARTGAPVAGAVVSLEVAASNPAEGGTGQLVQQSTTDAGGIFSVSRWSNPVWRKGGWRGAGPVTLKVFARDYRHLQAKVTASASGDRWTGPKRIALASLAADRREQVREIGLMRAELPRPMVGGMRQHEFASAQARELIRKLFAEVCKAAAPEVRREACAPKICPPGAPVMEASQTGIVGIASSASDCYRDPRQPLFPKQP